MCYYYDTCILYYRPHPSSDSPSLGGVYVNVSSSPKNSDNDISHQRLYYIFDHRLVLPEYCISVRYDGEEKKACTPVNHNETNDNELIEMDPQPENKPK